MKNIHAVWKDGRIVPTEPVDWPDGTSLSIEVIGSIRLDETPEDLSGHDPAAIARRVAFYDSLPPMKMSEPEEVAWRAARDETKEYTIDRMQQRPSVTEP